MIIQEFSFGNFRSFKDIQTLNLSAAKIKSKDSMMDINNIIEVKGHNILKSKAIYGANASGKTNVIRALDCLKKTITGSLASEKTLEEIINFKLSTETENEPSFFQLIFWIDDIKYRYGYEANTKEIVGEWLYITPDKRELPLFIRDNQKIIKIDKTNFKEGSKLLSLSEKEEDDSDVFNKHSLFLSTLASFGFSEVSKKIVYSIKHMAMINGLEHSGLRKLAMKALNYEDLSSSMLQFIKSGDIGIEDMYKVNPKNKREGSEIDNEEILVVDKKKYDENLKLKESIPFAFDSSESEGTKKLFDLSMILLTAIDNNMPLFIDEFDARLHPELTKKIVKLFNSKANKGSQLVFVTHDTNLLSHDLLRRDQIDFVEKDKYGASHLYSLVEFKRVRNDSSFEKDYIKGKYGAIPFLGDFEKLITKKDV